MQAPQQKIYAIYFGDLLSEDDESGAYAKFYKNGNTWKIKPVHTYKEASKFVTEKAAKSTARSYPDLDIIGYIVVNSPVEASEIEEKPSNIKIFKLATFTQTYNHTITFEIDEENQKAILKNFCRDEMGVMSFLNGKIQEISIQEARAEYKKLLESGYKKV